MKGKTICKKINNDYVSDKAKAKILKANIGLETLNVADQ